MTLTLTDQLYAIRRYLVNGAEWIAAERTEELISALIYEVDRTIDKVENLKGLLT